MLARPRSSVRLIYRGRIGVSRHSMAQGKEWNPWKFKIKKWKLKWNCFRQDETQSIDCMRSSLSNTVTHSFIVLAIIALLLFRIYHFIKPESITRENKNVCTFAALDLACSITDVCRSVSVLHCRPSIARFLKLIVVHLPIARCVPPIS